MSTTISNKMFLSEKTANEISSTDQTKDRFNT